ncbi:UNVERIFIED_CONTAM: hypothetical protein K2H54_057561 [Gekko kuhli]
MASDESLPAPGDPINSAPTTKQDLVLLKEELLQAITTRVTDLIQPMQVQLAELAKDLRDTSKIAENTAELTLSLQDDVKTLRSTDQHLNSRITSLENRWRMLNLKFRGIAEGMEEEAKVQVLLDLSSETLDKRRSLKLFANKLFKANIRFRWSPTSDLHVYRNGLLHQASDSASGKTLLAALGLNLTEDEERALSSL